MPALITHGESGRRTNGRKTTRPSTEFYCWSGMRTRCYNKNDKAYPRYGGRGIKMSPEWRDSFTAFLRDMGRRPSNKHSIHRVDNDGDYCKENCVWATIEIQNRNTRRNRLLTINGKTLCVTEWARESGVKCETVFYRLYNGWSPERAVFTPPLSPQDCHLSKKGILVRAPSQDAIVRLNEFFGIEKHPTE